MSEAAENAGVIAPPPLLAAAALVLGLTLDWLAPAYLLTVLLTLTARILIGALLMAAGFGLVIPANLVFRRAGTHPEPWKPSLTLVTGGVLAWMRNPMYVGGTLILLGLALALASDWTVVMTVASRWSCISAWSGARSAISPPNSASPTGVTQSRCRATACSSAAG